jgi:hypothetical protein
MKFEAYETVWNTGGPTSVNFDPEIVPPLIPENSQSDYRKHHVKWNTIFKSSVHPGAIRFREALKQEYGAKYNEDVIS